MFGSLFSQFEWGAKFGASFPSETDLLKLVSEMDQLGKLENSDTGWQVGFYGKIGPLSVQINPEHIYSENKSFQGFWEDHYPVVWSKRYNLWNYYKHINYFINCWV